MRYGKTKIQFNIDNLRENFMKDQDLINQYCDYIVQNQRTEANEALFVDMIM